VTDDFDVDEIQVPDDGVWRVARGPDPYETRPPLTGVELDAPRAGNRFDSPLGSYSVLYFCTQLTGCFGEVLARFRPDLRLIAILKNEWSDLGFMPGGELNADWRRSRLAVRALPADDQAVFLDIEAIRTREALMRPLAPILTAYGASDLDVATVRSGDRRITRWVSWWAWSQLNDDGAPRYAGIRYLSRLNSDWECWAIFDRVPTRELERDAIPETMPEMQEIARLFKLRVF
jgi:hypothetical protein